MEPDRHSNGFTMIHNGEFRNLTKQRIPKRLRAVARTFWLECLFRANRQDGSIVTDREVFEIKRGQLVMGLHEMAEEIGCSVKNIRTVINILKKLLEVASKTTNRGTVLTLLNYDTYVCDGTKSGKQSGKQAASKRQASGNSLDISRIEDKDLIHMPDKPKQQAAISTATRVVIDQVIEHYKAKIQPDARTTTNAENKIKTRLKTFTVDDLKKSIDNFKGDNWQMEHNSKRGLTWLFASDSRIEHYLSIGIPAKVSIPRSQPPLNG